MPPSELGGNIIDDVLRAARDLLVHETPLSRNCGELCGALCCRDEGEDGDGDRLGMLLFPGEERLYSPEDGAWMKIEPTEALRNGAPVPLLICNGECPREKRPLACRIFPLAPSHKKQGVRIDARAAFLCPLTEHGMDGFRPEFVAAVQKAFEVLASDPTQRDYLLWLSRLINRHERLVRMFARKET